MKFKIAKELPWIPRWFRFILLIGWLAAVGFFHGFGHFNSNNMELVQGIVRAAEKLNAPVILATSEGAIKYAGMEYLFCLAQTAAHQVNVPVALHLDHGQDLEVIRKAITMGYSSVMIDASHEPFEKNIRRTTQV